MQVQPWELVTYAVPRLNEILDKMEQRREEAVRADQQSDNPTARVVVANVDYNFRVVAATQAAIQRYANLSQPVPASIVNEIRAIINMLLTDPAASLPSDLVLRARPRLFGVSSDDS